MKNNSNDTLEILKAANDVTGRLDLSPGEMKPCVAKIIESRFSQGDCPSRNVASNIICSELLRIGMIDPEIDSVLSMWNQANVNPLRERELRSALATARKKLIVGGYQYSCNNQYLKAYCVDGYCQHKKHLGKFRCANNRSLFTYGWSKLLSTAEMAVYITLIELERRKGVGAGGLLIITHRNIAVLSISLKHVGVTLMGLKNVGLIEYKPGTPRKWQKKASEIRRIIPIPKPSKEQLTEIENKVACICSNNTTYKREVLLHF